MPLPNDIETKDKTTDVAAPAGATPADSPSEGNTSVRATLERAFADRSEPSKDQAAPGGDPAKPGTPDPAAPADKKTAEPAADIAPPAKWTKEEKEAWVRMTDGLTPEAADAIRKQQRILISRNKGVEAEFTRNMQAMAADRAWKSDLDKVLEPQRGKWKAAGLTDSAAIQQLVEGFEYSNRDLPGFINWLCAQRGTTLPGLFPQLAASGGQQQRQQAPGQDDDDGVKLHPKVQRMLDSAAAEINNLKGQLGQFAGHYQQTAGQWQQHQQMLDQQQQAEVANQIQSFASATDDSGQAKHPFYAEVAPDMGRLIAAGLADDLADAYEKAVYQRPELRQKLLESHDVKVKREFEAKLKSDAERARRASGSIPPGGGNARVPPQHVPAANVSVRDALDAALAARTGAGRI